MKKILINSFSQDKGFYFIEKPMKKEDFLNITVEDILIQHHRKSADTTLFATADGFEKDKILILVTQDKSFINDFKMLPPNPRKTKDIFEDNNQNKFETVSINKIIKDMTGNQIDYEMDVDGRGYSFRIVKGIKVKNTLEKFHLFIEESINIKEYKNKI